MDEGLLEVQLREPHRHSHMSCSTGTSKMSTAKIYNSSDGRGDRLVALPSPALLGPWLQLPKLSQHTWSGKTNPMY